MKNEKFKLQTFLSKQPQNIQNLFIKVVNLHAAYQMNPLSKKELLGRIRNEIEQAAKKEVD